MVFLLFIICSTLTLFSAPPKELDLQKPLKSIAFGTCYRAHKGHSNLWPLVLQDAPDLWIWMGDSYYADKWRFQPAMSEDDFYEAQALNFESDMLYQKLSETTPVIATWDDHDYGKNNGGRDYEFKIQSKKIFLDFHGEPEASERRLRKGLYTSYMYGPKGQRVQIILLDLRTFRSPLKVGKALLNPLRGKFLPEEDPYATMLGYEQWNWLSQELEKDADLRIIGSSVQFVAGFDGWEAWANFPREKKKLVNLIKSKKAEGVVFMSGDAYKGELHLQEFDECYPLWELTCGSLTSGAPHNETKTLCGLAYEHPNYGLLKIDWNTKKVIMQIKGEDGVCHISKSINFDSLNFDSANLKETNTDKALGFWRHRFGTFFITKASSGVYINNYVDRGRKGTIRLVKRDGFLVGKREVDDEKGICKFRITKGAEYLQGFYSKDSEEPLYNWNGWREEN